MQNILNVIVFIFVLGSIIFIHELGHFLAAKKFGIYCDQFALGMGPTLYSKKVGETTYSLKALPIGGFVAMAGEADQEDNPNMVDLPKERTIPGIATYKQVIIMLAGVFMNVVLALILVFGINVTSGIVATDRNMIGTVVEEYPAAIAGLQENDQIIKITVKDSNQEFIISNYNDIATAMTFDSNKQTDEKEDFIFTVVRDGQTKDITVSAIRNEDNNKYIVGFNPETRSMTILESFQYTGSDILDMSTTIFKTLGRMLTDTEVFSQLSGPIGIYTITSQVTESGNFLNVIYLMALFSINVGVFNLLPIPGLDGSQVLFAVIEKIAKRPIPIKIRYVIQTIGLTLVFGLMIFVSFNDIMRLFG